MPSLLKNHLKMNHPRINPDTKSREYHLRETGPIERISGFILQLTTKVSNIIYKKLKPAFPQALSVLRAECCDTWEFLALEILEHSTTTS